MAQEEGKASELPPEELEDIEEEKVKADYELEETDSNKELAHKEKKYDLRVNYANMDLP